MRYHDFDEFLASCNAHGVRYLVVGAHAVAFHARPRATKDLDLYVDLLSSLSGIDRFEDAWARRVVARYGAVETNYLSLDDLISAKRSAGRAQDRADLEHLQRAKQER